jgi:hypothetical protein
MPTGFTRLMQSFLMLKNPSAFPIPKTGGKNDCEFGNLFNTIAFIFARYLP